MHRVGAKTLNSRKSFSNTRFLIDDESVLKDLRFFITGFYGLGLCGYLTTKILYDAAVLENKLQRIAIVWSDSVPPLVEVDNGGRFRFPIEVYRVDSASAILLFRYQPSIDLQISIADIITDIAKKYNMTLVLCGGIDINALPTHSKKDADVVYVCNNVFEEKYIKNLESWNVPKSPPEIVVSGGIALILMHADLKSVPAVSLLTPTIARAGYMDYFASMKLAKRLIRLFDIDLSLEPIEEQIQRAEAQRLLQTMKKRKKPEKIEEIEEPEEFGIT